MYTKYAFAFAALTSVVSAHGVVTAIQGANGVNMPGLSLIDGTPRDCALPTCGSEADTTVFQGNNPLGKTNGGGAVSAAKMIQLFMGSSGTTTATTGKAATRRGLLDGLLGGAGAGGAGGAGGLGGLLGGAGGAAGGAGGLLGGAGGAGGGAAGTKTAAGAKENTVAKAAGAGAASGLPTAADDGTVTLSLHQVNQDGAGPFAASVDSTSGGTEESAFKEAEVTQNVGGFQGLSAVSTTDFPVKVQVPAGTVCSANVGGASNVCIMRLKNQALAGPFGGSVAFTQTPAQKKRALEYRRIKRSRIARAI